ncbi:TPA: ead/Ea22-like family protein [Raoultella ornithinolytica]|uniref:ead/Ea22-like family protein n=1 Tax=Raoultella ornithinolytica TaxID=54291 RepID=UPI0025B2D67D|nr:ead/Ea22-like family protein [Raoultella ornithinolytica]MDN3781159.1 ead/Ea22-like family protein [Raoultella ornithinolytica]
MTTDITELAPAMKAAAELITSGYSRKWIVSHDDETCWVGANDDDGNLNPFIEVSIADWSGNKVDNETLARFISLCRPANILALVEALEKAQAKATQQGNIAVALFDEVTQQRRHADEKAPELRAQLIEADSELEALRQRIAELELEREHLRPVGVMSEKAYHRLENRESRFIALWPRPEIYLPRKRPEDGVIVYARTAAAAGIKVEADIVDADVSDRNQPGMVVAVHIDAGDFVKFRGQVYEVRETGFDDHDVTLWFVCGEVLKCAAGCPIEVVTAPEEAE